MNRRKRCPQCVQYKCRCNRMGKPRPRENGCNTCSGLPHRRDKPVCPECGLPYRAERYVRADELATVSSSAGWVI